MFLCTPLQIVSLPPPTYLQWYFTNYKDIFYTLFSKIVSRGGGGWLCAITFTDSNILSPSQDLFLDQPLIFYDISKATPLAYYLLKPVKRVTEYPLLIDKLVKHTPREHPDHGYIREALTRAKTLCEQVSSKSL